MSSKANQQRKDDLGVVVIGRNEGDRLARCFRSLTHRDVAVVYVDSGSADDSIRTARVNGIEVVELDRSAPFSAARARNVGHQQLVELNPKMRFVQFVDGDCEICHGWLAHGLELLRSRPDVAVVAGTVRERYPDASIYNRLGDFEWNSNAFGEVSDVGGVFMIRREAFESIGGFDASVRAGEEPELCQRLRRCGWRLLRLNHDMALHDLAITRFADWWTRHARNGYGALDVANRFGVPGFARMTHRARFWSGWLLLAIAATLLTALTPNLVGGAVAFLLISSIWLVHSLRIVMRTWQKGHPLKIAIAYSFYTMVSYWPQMIGQIRYWMDRRMRRASRLIEYRCASRGMGQKK
jgi:GT2 family glycosyltransferase